MTDFYAGVRGLQVANPIPSPGLLLFNLWRGLRLEDETLALAYAYFKRCLKTTLPPGTCPAPWLDNHTLALTCLNLAAKMTDFPRLLPKILVVAWRLLHGGAPSPFPPSEAPGSSSRLADCPLFCSLRNAIDAAETVLLRVLAFNVHFDTPVHHDQICLARALAVNEDDSNPTTRDGVKLEPQLEKTEDTGIEAPQDGGHERKITLIEDLPVLMRQQIRGLSLEAHSFLSSFSAKVVAMAAVFTVLSENHLAPPFVSPLDAHLDEAYILNLKAWTRAVHLQALQINEAKEFSQAVWCMRGILGFD